MANQKLSSLTTLTTPASTDIAYVVQSGTSYQVTLSNLAKGIVVTNLDVTGLTGGDILAVNSGGTAVEGKSASGVDASVITGTAGTNGDLAQWNSDGDLVDGPTPPTGTIVGTSDTQTLSNKTLTTPNIGAIRSGGITVFNLASGGFDGTDVLRIISGESGTRAPRIDATGTSTNINVVIEPKGAGNVVINSNDLDLNDSTGNIQVNSTDPYMIISLPAESWTPTTTSPCGGPTQIEAATNDIDYFALEFDASSDENAFKNFRMPDNWDAGPIQFRYVWTNAGGGSAETVVMELAGRSYANDDAIDQAVGTPIEVSDTWIAQGDIHYSGWSADVTLAGTAAAGEWVHLELMRDVSEDDLTGDARIIEVQLRYRISQYEAA